MSGSNSKGRTGKGSPTLRSDRDAPSVRMETPRRHRWGEPWPGRPHRATREPNGAVTAIDWEPTFRRWTQDYDFARSNQTAVFLEPRGLGAIASKLSDAEWTYAATGALGTQRFAPIAPARQAAIYTDDIARAAARLRVRPTDTGSNVVLAEPCGPVVFDRSTIRDDVRIVAASKLAVDLLTGPGRDPSE